MAKKKTTMMRIDSAIHKKVLTLQKDNFPTFTVGTLANTALAMGIEHILKFGIHPQTKQN